MIIHNKRAIKQFGEREPKAVNPLNKWIETVEKSDWQNSAELKQTFNSANIVAKDKWIFDISGNNYRLAGMVWFASKVVQILKVMNHAEYDKEKWEDKK